MSVTRHICKDCKYYQEIGNLHQCHREAVIDYDRVTGEDYINGILDPFVERADLRPFTSKTLEKACGFDGKYWEPK